MHYRVNIEISVVRIFFFEVIFQFNVRVTVKKDVNKSKSDSFYLRARELGTHPDNKTENFIHGLAPLFYLGKISLTSKVEGETSFFTECIEE
ncbi:hypothetical protein [Thermodesulfovibrio hydrogeniphilus]